MKLTHFHDFSPDGLQKHLLNHVLEQHSALGREIGEIHQISIKYQYFMKFREILPFSYFSKKNWKITFSGRYQVRKKL